MGSRTIACVRRLWRDRSAATAIEYGLIAALISISIIVWAISIGTSVTGFFDSVGTAL